MAAPQYRAADFKHALQALLPHGRVWPRTEDNIQSKVAAGITKIYERSTDRANQLLVDAFPATTYELLPEWESSLGLPDPCQGLDASVEGRRNQVVARYVAEGGQSVPYFIKFAADLGYVITITEYAPFRCGGRCGTPLYGDDWAHVWQVNAPTFTINYFRTGISGAGEYLASWGNTVLQCELQKLKPAHTILIFSYT